MSGYWSGILAILAINVIFAYGIFIPAAAGQLNLGGAGFMAIGAYAAAMLGEALGWTPAETIPAAVAITGCVGIAIAFPVLRTRGVYMVLATFAFAQVVTGVILTQPALGGAMGLVVPDYVGLDALLGAAAGATLLVFWLMASRFGLALRALHDDELVSTIMGVPARAMQVASFAIGAGLAGLAGGLYAHHFSFVEAQYFNPLLSIYVLLFVLIGGTQTAWGPLVGASFFTIVPELLRVGGSWRYVAFGAIIVAMMILRPEGIVTRTALARLSGRRADG
ncbi:branched-chain amino acid ABC transporter permease [Falsiroseomonas sp. HW251]|uniref:branched-chain amino acid ABC transporter permease n=1 Tax=Falsiroseomonas sp. HW251 TaxID=3390998 RepID=UPI003D3223E4